MPVIRRAPQDPTDLIVAGEHMRLAAIGDGVHAALAPGAMVPLLCGAAEPALAQAPVLIAGEQGYAPMHQAFTPYHARQRNGFAGAMIAANAVISTPCGAIYPVYPGGIVLSALTQSTQRWVIAGVTRDSVGAALGNCRVVILETGRLAAASTPYVAETISDGSGNYSVEVALNVAHQAIAYLSGTPDVAGISKNDLAPMANG